ncbi:hypothetical protein PHJA_001003300 [Phtheirospermum japonicum]|uniref:Uncharacterized protein n=1 Tax=Phtheirospermum japonicum TaxID=374723 RepID=A0A830BP30_9LAMI|nr:hypothetical protein PHJA_001003300 [Phtheirospermum japonicum]
MDIWSWICELPNSNELDLLNSHLTFQLAHSNPSSTQSIQLRAEPTLGSNSEPCITFSICFLGFDQYSSDHDAEKNNKIIWASDTCPLSSDKPFLPLVLQLLQEIVSRAPTAHDSTCPRSQLQKLKPEPISWILDSHSPESFSSFFNLVFLTRLFWLCVCDAPSQVGSFYFHSVLAPNLGTFSCKHAPVLRNFFFSVGTDVELCFTRTFGYMLAKWLILRDVELGLKSLTILPPENLGFSYAVESHGLWVLKGYTPVKSMQCVQCYGQKSQFPGVVDARESLLKYALAHQQLEAVIQFEYTVRFCENYIQVNARVDNIRIHVVKLGFKKDSGEEFLNEKHFPSRIRVWVGPEVGASYVGGLSLGRPTDNVEQEMEIQKTLKGISGNSKVPEVKEMARMAARTKVKNWRWDQDVDGNAATFDGILCDNTTGVEIATWKPPIGGGQMGGFNFRSRYAGGGRPFTKSGGLIIAGEEYGGEGVGWRLSKEMEGSVLKWRIGGQVWLSYWPNGVNTSYCETRCVEWCDEVDLPLILSNKN